MGHWKNWSSLQRQSGGLIYARFKLPTTNELILIFELQKGTWYLIFRWDINSVHQLPEYMKPCYQAVLDVYKEIEEMENTERSYCVHHTKDAVGFFELFCVYDILYCTVNKMLYITLA